MNKINKREEIIINEYLSYKRLIESNPNGILSIVSDTYNIYDVVDKVLPALKKEILARDGKFVVRPDSGEPAFQLLGGIVAGQEWEEVSTLKKQMEMGLFGLIEKHFGSTVNDKGYKVLPIGFLWGDGMTPDKIEEVFDAMEKAGYASENLAIGMGSYLYQLNTRDTYGFAMKATYVEIDGKGINITKDPITDNGVKKSAKGLLAIIEGKLIQEAKWELVESTFNELREVE